MKTKPQIPLNKITKKLNEIADAARYQEKQAKKSWEESQHFHRQHLISKGRSEAYFEVLNIFRDI